MTEGELRASIAAMSDSVKNAAANISWEVGTLGYPSWRYMWFQGVPVQVFINQYFTSWWTDTGQIWYDPIDQVVNGVAHAIYDIYHMLTALDAQTNNIMKANFEASANAIEVVMGQIVTYVEQEFSLIENWVSTSIDYLYQFIDTEFDQVYSDINNIVAGVNAYVDEKLSDIFVDIDDDLQSVRDYVDTEIVTYGETVDLLFSDLYTDLDENVTAIENSIASLAGDALGWVVERVGAVWAWLKDTGNDIYLWINQQLSDLTNYVSQWVLDITQYIDNGLNMLNAAISSVYDALVSDVQWLINQITAIANEIKTIYDAAIETLTRGLDWSNLFFNLALTLPEFGMLSAMTRTDADFDKYKPFWQAFLSRILST